MKKTVTICFTNNKGGSGKSTTCSNLGAAMAQAGKKARESVLLMMEEVLPEDTVLTVEISE